MTPLRTDVYRSVTDDNAPPVGDDTVIARVRDGATLADAQAELDGFATRVEKEHPDSNARASSETATPM